ncbi:MAG: hypothetical protein ACPGWR_13700 [Ardenticatenaceae bacterium]
MATCSASNLRMMRLLIGDTNTTDQAFSDADLTLMWAENGQNIYFGAAMAADMMGAIYANEQSVTIGDVTVTPGVESPTVAYANLAKRLRAQGYKRTVSPFAGGISRGEKTTQRSDTDRVEPAFTKDLHEYVITSPELSPDERYPDR